MTDDRESTRAHILAALGDLDGLAAGLASSTPRSGLALIRLMLDRRAFLADELDWADEQAGLATDAESDVLTEYRLLVNKALVLTEHSLSSYPAENLPAAAAAGNALAALADVRRDVERLN